jgi:hypothetical protein
MYVWLDMDGMVHIEHEVRPPLASKGGGFLIPAKLFNRLLDKADALSMDDGKVGVGGATLEILDVNFKTGKRCSWRRDSHLVPRAVAKLSYKSDFVCMWLVTWFHILNGRSACVGTPKRSRALREIKQNASDRRGQKQGRV